MTQPYTPIDCSYYDRLEEAATLRRIVTIEYVQDGQPATVSAQITDLRLLEGAEWMILDSGLAIRLDDLQRVDGHELPGRCQIVCSD